jgi:flagellar basal body-associated protein FliL
MAARMKARRGAFPRTVAIVVLLVVVVVVVAAGVSLYRSLAGSGAKPTGVAATEPLPEGQFAPPERIAPGGQGGSPRQADQ